MRDSAWHMDSDEQDIVDLPVGEIKPRIDDLRSLCPTNLIGIARSIVKIGMLQPILIDKNNRILAGNHRWRAIQLLAAADRIGLWESLFKCHPSPKELSGINDLGNLREESETIRCRVMATKGNQSLKIEISENEARRNLSKEEICKVAQKLIEGGATNQRGPTKKGNKSLLKELEGCFNVSRRTILRGLSAPPPPSSRKTVSTSAKLTKTLKSWKKVIRKEGYSTEGLEMIDKAIDDLILAIEIGTDEKCTYPDGKDSQA